MSNYPGLDMTWTDVKPILGNLCSEIMGCAKYSVDMACIYTPSKALA